LSITSDDSIKFHEFVNPPAGQRVSFKNYGIPAPRNPDTFTAAEFKDPRPALLDNDGPAKKPRLHGHTICGHDEKFSLPL